MFFSLNMSKEIWPDGISATTTGYSDKGKDNFSNGMNFMQEKQTV